jgi:hypothetical protein
MHRHKNYRPETLFIAFGLFDRYLNRIIKSPNHTNVDLVLLSTACILLAAKANEPLTPSVKGTIGLLDSSYKDSPSTRQRLLDVEFHVVKTLEFDIQVHTPTVFLGRFVMLYTRGVTTD